MAESQMSGSFAPTTLMTRLPAGRLKAIVSLPGVLLDWLMAQRREPGIVPLFPLSELLVTVNVESRWRDSRACTSAADGLDWTRRSAFLERECFLCIFSLPRWRCRLELGWTRKL